jgi:hypothetical protein
VAFQQKGESEIIRNFQPKPIVAFLVVAVVNFKLYYEQTKAFYFQK